MVGAALVGGTMTWLGVGASVGTVDWAGVGVTTAAWVGAGVMIGAGDALAAGAESTPTAQVATEGPYAAEPPNDAVTLYWPGTGGVHCRLKRPFTSLVT